MMDFDNPFKDGDFHNVVARLTLAPDGYAIVERAIVDEANARFLDVIEQAQVIYGTDRKEIDSDLIDEWHTSKLPCHSRQARLICIEEIK